MTDSTSGDEPGTTSLERFVDQLPQDMNDVAMYLSERHPEPEMRDLYRQVRGPIRERASELRSALGDQESLADHLDTRGLKGGSVELTIKLRGYRFAAEAFRAVPWEDLPERGDHFAVSRRQRKRRWWSPRRWVDEVSGLATSSPGKRTLAKRMLRWANITLGSLGAIPGADALKEIKETLEAGLDEIQPASPVSGRG